MAVEAANGLLLELANTARRICRFRSRHFVVSPVLLLGRSFGAVDVVLWASAVLGLGLIVRWASAGAARAAGNVLVAIGGLLLIFAAGLIALLLAGLRGY